MTLRSEPRALWITTRTGRMASRWAPAVARMRASSLRTPLGTPCGE